MLKDIIVISLIFLYKTISFKNNLSDQYYTVNLMNLLNYSVIVDFNLIKIERKRIIDEE